MYKILYVHCMLYSCCITYEMLFSVYKYTVNYLLHFPCYKYISSLFSSVSAYLLYKKNICVDSQKSNFWKRIQYKQMYCGTYIRVNICQNCIRGVGCSLLRVPVPMGPGIFIQVLIPLQYTAITIRIEWTLNRPFMLIVHLKKYIFMLEGPGPAKNRWCAGPEAPIWVILLQFSRGQTLAGCRPPSLLLL